MSKKAHIPAKYFNFPIDMIYGFLSNTLNRLDNIFDYAVASHYIKMKGGHKQRLEAIENYYGVNFGDSEKVYSNGMKLLEIYEDTKNVMVGINTSVFWDYYNAECGRTNDKSEFEKICLVAYLALKSILQNKPYCKVTNKYWLSRMDGRNRSVESFHELSDDIRKYANEYQTKKIKNELVFNWNLVTYSYFTRGFYVSYKLSLDQLAYEAEKRRQSTKTKQRKIEVQNARIKALKKLNGQEISEDD